MNTLLSFSKIADITDGEWLNHPKDKNQLLRGGAFDTRNLGEAQIFFAWKGESSDGHKYLNQLIDSNIQLIIVEKHVEPVADIAVLKVKDSLQALHLMARELTSGFKGTVVNLTGSSGKTTTKEWLRHIVGSHRKLLTNIGSFNNHIGCPITILNLKEDDEVLILEMGTSGLGEIDLLTSIAPAGISLLLNVGHAHLGMLGSKDNIYKAKLEIFNHQKEGAVSILPSFDQRLKEFPAKGKKLLFGESAPDYAWSVLKIDPLRYSQTFQFKTPNGLHTAEVQKLGSYVGDLISAILAVCFELGLSWEQINEGLNTLPQEKGRSIFLKGLNDSLLLDDTYNANPESVIAMLRTISRLEKSRMIAVVGNLAELDADLSESSKVIVDNIPQNLTELYFCGETGKILHPLISDSFPKMDVKYRESIKELIIELKEKVSADTVVGIKGSRSSHMERLVYALTGAEINCELARCGKLMMCKECEEL